jgi:hypothetical protein
MMENANGSLSKRRRCAAFAITACGIAAAGAVHAGPDYSTVVVSPAELPAPAQQGGEAMLLRDTIDGRTILYVEQGRGTRIATFDVTDPAHVTSEGSQPLDASGPFDFTAATGDGVELVKYREGQGDAVLDLHRPVKLTPVDGLNLQIRQEITKTDTGTTFVLAENGLYVIRRPAVEMLHQLMAIPPN